MSHPVDVHVGATMRRLRRAAKLSQRELGEHMDGLTFQQIQKYERGTNRLSASKMWEAAKALHIHPADFFDGLSPASDGPQAGERQRAILDALALVPGVARLAELEPPQHAAIQTMIAAFLPRG